MIEFKVLLPNEVGSLALLSEELAARGINIISVSCISMGNPQVNSLITDKPNRSEEVFKRLNLQYEKGELLAVRLLDRPGALAHCCRKLSDAKLNIESISIIGKSRDYTEIALKVSDMAEARELLKSELVTSYDNL